MRLRPISFTDTCAYYRNDEGDIVYSNGEGEYLIASPVHARALDQALKLFKELDDHRKQGKLMFLLEQQVKLQEKIRALEEKK